MPSEGAAPDCTLQMCVDDYTSCSDSFTLTSSYADYAFTFESGPFDSNITATLNFTCYEPGSIALESVNLVAAPDPSAATAQAAQAVPTVTITETATVTSEYNLAQ